MSLAKEIQLYLTNNGSYLQLTADYYRQLPLDTAVRNAAVGMNPDGKMNSHQYLIGKKKGTIAAEELLMVIDHLSKANSFKEIFFRLVLSFVCILT